MDLSHHLAAIQAKRENSAPLPLNGVPTTSSYPFKIRDYSTLPMSKRWDDKFSIEGQRMLSSTLKSSQKSQHFVDMISLGIARPSPQYYPWSSISFEAEASSLDASTTEKPSITTSCNSGDECYNLELALNYGYAAGSPQLLRFVTEHVELVHNPPYNDWECCLTSGTTSALEMAFRVFCSRGDSIVVEDYLYAGTIDIAKAQGLNLVGLEMDQYGLSSDSLDSTLCQWDVSRGKKPSILITIPSGQNPTGTTQSLKRREAIYEVAERHDLYIIEDDPYYFIQLWDQADRTSQGLNSSITPEQYLNSSPVSYLSLDRSGRVLRMDSTSKIIAPGMRCGWITACSPVISRFLARIENSTVAPSGPSQAMLYKLLEETWGHKGFFKRLIYLSLEYSRRLTILLQACRKHLPPEFCRWEVPTSGMFLWLQIDISKHPSLGGDAKTGKAEHTYQDIEDRIYQKAQANGVQVSKGSWFAAGKIDAKSKLYFRLTFASAPETILTGAVERFGVTLRAEFREENVPREPC